MFFCIFYDMFQNMKENYLISLTIPYVNATPHIGYALECIQGDVMARYKRFCGKDVFFLSGTDENSLKNVQAAEKAGMSVEDFVKKHAEEFFALKDLLNLSWNDFIRTTEERHFSGAQKLWKLCENDIYKKKYSGLYCVGCEAFYDVEDLENGKCPDHKIELEQVDEENYFFALSKYQTQIEDALKNNKVRTIPESRKGEMLAFVEKGLQDFSISRSRERAHGWGVPVPGDEHQIMYVWFDALSNYINALGFGSNQQLFEKFWVQSEHHKREVVHVLGKGVAKFHLLYWIGMLLSAKLPLPTAEFIHGYITVNGEKMSKSIGNVVSPSDLVNTYGKEATRYYFLSAMSSYQDGDYSKERFEEIYTAHLVNGIGNLTSRILTMIEKYSEGKVPAFANDIFDIKGFWVKYHESFENFAFHETTQLIHSLLSACDVMINESKPWEKFGRGQPIADLLYQLIETLRHIAIALVPLLPDTAQAILERLGRTKEPLKNLSEEQIWGQLAPGSPVVKGDILFPRLKKENA